MCVYMPSSVYACVRYASEKRREEHERERERETERGKRQTALHSDNLRAGRRTKGVGNPRASERASRSVRTAVNYIDFDFRRRAHLALSLWICPFMPLPPSYRGHWSCPVWPNSGVPRKKDLWDFKCGTFKSQIYIIAIYAIYTNANKNCAVVN